ncbi:Detected protein of unknown function [Hibiscus syriacus]|uniref:Uncharacterized protein n=1 Tax=Hibiscus syriacus TaxID=106335 RepID=A0A6A3B179_HIBSY|nr:uncharacterized protein LOC120119247 [Hibiscus syriacus]KAE8708849.1 Detected protein of unknown function [Hibiscus syriacus]
MASKQIESHREGAEIYNEPSVCRQKVEELLDQCHIPKGLMPLTNLVELGHNNSSGFIWLKQAKATKYKFKELGATSYGPEITAFIKDRELKSLTGIKSKEMIIWVTLAHVTVDDSEDPGKITFSTTMGLSKTYPLTAIEDDPKEMK